MSFTEKHFFRIGSFVFCLSFFLALIYALDPNDASFGAESVPVFKYLPIFMASLSLIFFIDKIRLVIGRYKIEFFSVGILALWMILGGIISIKFYHLNVENSFLGRGLCTSVFIPSLFMFSSTTEKNFFLNINSIPLKLYGVISVLLIVSWTFVTRFARVDHIFHEEVFLIGSCGMYLYSSFRDRILKNLLIAGFILGVFLTHKNTGFIVGFIMIAFFVYEEVKRRSFRHENIMFRRIFLVLIGFFIIFVVLYVVFFASQLIPSGSPGVRIKTYDIRIGEFLKSIVLGKFFIGSPLIELRTKYSSLIIPSHSDLLDLLAFGGIVGLGLFFGPIFVVLKFLKRRGEMYPSLFVGIFLVMSFVIESAFNPIINQPKLSFFYWTFLAFVVTSIKERCTDKC